MKKNAALLTFTLLSLSLPVEKAFTDEVWTTEEYDVVYEEDRNRTAVWSYGDNGGTIFIDGLAGVYEGRESYSGYWVQDSSSLRCDTYREGANGEPTYHWGGFEVEFLDADFPSRWQAQVSLCDRRASSGENRPPAILLNGTPVVGSPVQPTQPVRGLY